MAEGRMCSSGNTKVGKKVKAGKIKIRERRVDDRWARWAVGEGGGRGTDLEAAGWEWGLDFDPSRVVVG
jgi:hypothetical protein